MPKRYGTNPRASKTPPRRKKSKTMSAKEAQERFRKERRKQRKDIGVWVKNRVGDHVMYPTDQENKKKKAYHQLLSQVKR